MEQIEVDPVGTQAPQALVARGRHAEARRVDWQDLADDEDLVTPPANGLAYHLFRATVAIHLGGVDERHAEIQTQSERGHLVGATDRLLAHAPRPLAENRYLVTRRQSRCPDG